MSLGPLRSYSQLASRLHVSKRSIVRRATAERWKDRAAAIRVEAQKKTDATLADTLHDVNQRHLKVLRVIEGKGLQALQSLPMTTAGEAARTVLAAMAQERGILETPGATGGVTIVVTTGVPEPNADSTP